MRDRQRITWALLLGILAISPPGFSQNQAIVDPDVEREFATNGEGTFLVLLREKADLTPAFEITDWGARGRFVSQRLKRVADSSQAGLREMLTAWGAQFKPFWIVNSILVTSDDAALVYQVAMRPEVAEIRAPVGGEIPQPVPGEELPAIEAIEWNIDRIRAPLIWSTYGVTGTDIVVANLDSGVQFDHPALVNQYRGNMGGGVFDHNYNWYDPEEVCASPSTEPCDLNGHGTRTMGVMVGDDGGVNQIGVAPGARWIAARLCPTSSQCFLDAALAAGQWFLAPTDLNGQNPLEELRPHVINNSWSIGPPGGGDDTYLGIVQAWIASGIFPQFAIGNFGPTCGSGTSPGDYEESYAAGAFDINDDIWVSSSRGPSAFGSIKPNITAPGVSIRSSTITDAYLTDSGTSYSSPHVAGTVALIWSGRPELIGEITATRSLLDRAAIDTSDLSCGGTPENNNVWGEGRLDALDAFEAVVIFEDGFESGDTSAWSNTVP